MVRKWTIKLIIFFLGGFFSSLIFCPPCYAISLDYTVDTIRYYTIIFAILWEMNRYIIRRIDEKLDWITETQTKVFANIGLLFLLTIPLILACIYIAFEVIGPRPLNYTSFSWMAYYSLGAYHFFTGLVISLLLNSQNFFNSWKETIVREQAAKQQQVAYQLQALVNQVNPHFLFNNLHTLTSVLRQDSQLAEQFIYQLSKVYRYLLSGNRSQAVYIEEEKKFLNAYFFLLNIRFGDCIKIEFSAIAADFKVAPITLQMLIENAIKHNVAEVENPLIIKIYEEENYLIVKNNLQLKSSVGYTSGIGLKNILERYRLLSKQRVIIEEDSTAFVVKLPNLKTTKIKK